MAVATFPVLALILVLAAVPVPGDAAGSYYSHSFINMTNTCSNTVWPAISSGADSTALEDMGFALTPGQWSIIAVPFGWTGRVWARTLLCSTEDASPGYLAAGFFASAVFTCGGGGSGDTITYTIIFCPISTSGYTTPVAGNQSCHSNNQVDESRIALIISILSLVTAVLGLLAQCLGLIKKCCS